MQYAEKYSKCRRYNIKLFEKNPHYTHHNIQISQFLDTNSDK